MKTAISITIVLLVSITAVLAQGYGTIGPRDVFGNRQIRYPNGLQGTLGSPDVFGTSTLRYNNGTTIQYMAPDVFGNRRFQIQTMPRRGW
jgi:hypothetical protein